MAKLPWQHRPVFFITLPWRCTSEINARGDPAISFIALRMLGHAAVLTHSKIGAYHVPRMEGLLRKSRHLLIPAAAALAAFLSYATGALAQSVTIRLDVDATEAPRHVLHARLTLPVKPGPTTIVYPKWIPGEHGPTGPIVNVAGLKLTAGGRTVPWKRDGLDMFAIHLDVPAGTAALNIELDLLLSSDSRGFSSAASASSELAVISWNQLLFYPQSTKADDITFTTTLRVPPGWKFGTALPVANEASNDIEFRPVSLTTLVDSPVLTGRHFKSYSLPAVNGATHQIDVAADSAAAAEMKPELVQSYGRLVREFQALFGARHYRHYRWLLTLSDRVASFGLEHHESSDDRMPERTLLDESTAKRLAGLLAHEYAHSWNGKFRRPAGLATPNYQEPMSGELLWVYEGLTNYLGDIMPARSGLQTTAEFRDQLANTAAVMAHSTGRTWRPLEDTAVSAQLLYEAPREWNAWRRGVDFYDEGTLLWLEADVIIRRQTGGKRSLNDFCRAFHGGESSAPAVKPYTFGDIVKGLNDVVSYDWRGFLEKRVQQAAPDPPLGGISGSGWTLVYTDTPSEAAKSAEQFRKSADFTFSIGLQVGEDGGVLDVVPGLAAAKSGLGPGMKIVAINNRRYTSDGMHAAVKATKTGESIELLAQNGDYFKTYSLDYKGGERYPHLERDPSMPDLLSEIVKPLAAQ